MSPAAPAPALVSHGLTLKGAQLSWAILENIKLIENRSVQLPVGWIALHTGIGKLPKERAMELEQCPGIPPEASLPHGAIVGALRVDRACTVADCAGTPAAPWALGPVCNVIGAVCQLAEPIQHKGAARACSNAIAHETSGRPVCAGSLGTWPIDADVLMHVRAGLAAATIMENNPALLPPAGASLRRERKRQRPEASP